MADNVEQIEAKLAAYIDGELTPDERVELERHLDANPTHRGLIRELSGHRDLLRALPREPAPADLSEPLAGDMERDALLGGGDPLTEFKIGRARRWWPQLLAAAAIFILAFGLGAIVFYVLPPKHPTVAIVQPPDADSDAEAGVARDGLAQEKEIPLVAGAETTMKDERSIPGPVAQSPGENLTVAGSALADGGADALYGRPVAPADRIAAPPGDTLVITITADNVQQASTELLNYFSTNGIAWSEPGNPEVLATLAKAAAPASTMADMAPLAPVIAPSDSVSVERGVRSDPKVMAESATGGVEAERVGLSEAAARIETPAPTTTPEALRSRPYTSRDAAPAPAPAPAAPTTRPTLADETQPPGRGGAAEGEAGDTAGAAPGTSRYVVLAALDRPQAERLAGAFARPAIGRRAEVRRQAVTIPAGMTRAQAPASVGSVEVRFTPLQSTAQTATQGGEEFRLLRPATQPAATTAWESNDPAEPDSTSFAAPATRPSQPFAFEVESIEKSLAAPVFNCVVVLRTPDAPAPATQPVAAPATRPAR